MYRSVGIAEGDDSILEDTMSDHAPLTRAPETAHRMSAFAGEQKVASGAVAFSAPQAGGLPARPTGDRRLLDSDVLESIDRKLNAATARLTMGVSPVALM